MLLSLTCVIGLCLVCSSLLRSADAAALNGVKMVLSRGAQISERILLKSKDALPRNSLFEIRGGASKTVIEVGNLQQLEKILSDAGKGKLIVLDFTASWCGPCRMIAPIYEQLSGEFSKVVFTKVDVDKAQDVAAKYEVKSMPTFLFIKNGKVMARFSGASVEKLNETIKLYQ